MNIVWLSSRVLGFVFYNSNNSYGLASKATKLTFIHPVMLLETHSIIIRLSAIAAEDSNLALSKFTQTSRRN